MSRCLRRLIISSPHRPHPVNLIRFLYRPLNGVRSHSTRGNDFSSPIQSYLSRSTDPYLNLSIEHHLLQRTAPDSAVLFLYVNRPCVVIGRNQNPWTEVNLPLLSTFRSLPPLFGGSGEGRTPAGTLVGRGASGDGGSEDGCSVGLDLVRRRSGGGTVFHDYGNVNWTVICPSATFTRDKHAEMVVRALRRLGVERCRVNERHDIVLDLGTERTGVDTEGRNGREEDTHTTPWTGGETRKVSGSAYKLTRGRALHHGTALLGSGNLGRIKEVLTAVGRGVIESKGVESVSSTVANVEVENEAFVEEVRSEFANMYERVEGIEVDETWLEDEGLRKGWEELKSLDWTYCQTPRFKIRNDSFATGDGRGLPSLVMEAKGGFVDTVEVKKPDQVQGFAMDLKDKSEKFKIHELRDWTRVLSMWEATSATELDSSHKSRLASWLRDMLPSGA